MITLLTFFLVLADAVLSIVLCVMLLSLWSGIREWWRRR